MTRGIDTLINSYITAFYGEHEPLTKLKLKPSETRQFFILRGKAKKFGLRLQLAKSAAQAQNAGGMCWLTLPGSTDPLESFAEFDDAAKLLETIAAN
ncbi:MAG: hypothetical protein NXI15_05535 [Gammaproteobacteria bacterium]|nr:hypothetical protein [Gammaproteobacteria bacterium]